MAETPMNIYAKLQEAKSRFLAAGAKKSGINRHAEFTYFELSDIVPIATKIFSDLHLTFMVEYYDENAVGTLIDIDAPECKVSVTFPMTHIAEPAKFRMNEVQALGAEITYTRRYLYMLLLDIVEADVLDAGDGPKEPEPEKPKAEPKKKAAAPKTKEERKAIKEELTSEETPATDEEREEVRGLMTRVLNAFPDQEEFLMEIMEKTEGLEKLTAIQAAQLKEGLEAMLREVA